jgi:hypothetical protein
VKTKVPSEESSTKKTSSSSSSKHGHHNHHHKKDKKDKHKDKSSSKSRHSTSTKEPIMDDFASALKKASFLSSSSKKASNGSSSSSKMAVVDVEIPADINPNYKPRPQIPSKQNLNGIYNSKMCTDDEALSAMMAHAKSGRSRTSVYSGRKTSAFSKDEKFPSLMDLCIHTLQDHVHLIDECGSASYDLIKPVLERAKADDLSRIEDFNPRFVEDTGKLYRLR